MAMISRKLVQQSRAIITKSRFIEPFFTSRFYNQSLRILPLPVKKASKYYSTTTETTTSTKEEAPPERVSESQSQNEDSATKELDTKNREIIELRVRPQRPPIVFSKQQSLTNSRINTYAQ